MKKFYDYTIYREDGSAETFYDEPKWPLERMQEAVGGLIELLAKDFTPNLDGEYDAYGNDEAKLLGMERNQHFPTTPWGDYIAGPVLVEERAIC